LLEVEYKGNTISGFVKSAGINTGKNQAIDIEMLISPDTDMSLL
jgi:hypothetical protein